MTKLFVAACLLLALIFPVSAQTVGEFSGYDVSPRRVEAGDGAYDVSFLRQYRREHCQGSIDWLIEEYLDGEVMVIVKLATVTAGWPVDERMDLFAYALRFPRECMLKLVVGGPDQLSEATDFVLMGGPGEYDILIREATERPAQSWDYHVEHDDPYYTAVQHPLDPTDLIALRVPDEQIRY